MKKLIEASVGATFYRLDLATLNITELKSKGLVLTDERRKLYKIYFSCSHVEKTILFSEEDLTTVQDNCLFSLNLNLIQDAKTKRKEQVKNRIIKEIREKLFEFKKLEPNTSEAKQRILDVFGKM